MHQDASDRMKSGRQRAGRTASERVRCRQRRRSRAECGANCGSVCPGTGDARKSGADCGTHVPNLDALRAAGAATPSARRLADSPKLSAGAIGECIRVWAVLRPVGRAQRRASNAFGVLCRSACLRV